MNEDPLFLITYSQQVQSNMLTLAHCVQEPLCTYYSVHTCLCQLQYYHYVSHRIYSIPTNGLIFPNCKPLQMTNVSHNIFVSDRLEKVMKTWYCVIHVNG